jgi:capsular exopolysaccharide synthesis family protein
MNNEQSAIEQVLRVVRRRRLVILQAVILVPLIALGFSLLQGKQYTATATLFFRQPPTTLGRSSSVVDPTREAATNGELVSLPVVAERAAGSLPGVSPEEVLGSVSVSPSENADTATIAATTGDPELSAEMANAYGDAYIVFRRNADRGQVQDAINLAEKSLEELTPVGQEGAEGAALRRQLDELKLTQALQTGGAELVQQASPPGSPSSPQVKRNVVFGLLLGLLFGLGLAFLLDRIDRRVRTISELEELYRLPVLARIPRSKRLSLAREDMDAIQSQTQEGEAFGVLRTNLRYFNVQRDLRSLLIVSPEEGDGKSTVARSLATTMARMGDDVAFVEADLRKESSFTRVDGRPAGGLSNVLAGTPVDRMVLKVDVQASGQAEPRSLAVLPSGPVPPNPAELLESPRMREVLDELEASFELVIFDSPALSAVSDALALVPIVSQVVVVGGLGTTTRDDARELSSQLALLDKKPIGVVVNFVEAERARYSHYYRSPASQRSPAAS